MAWEFINVETRGAVGLVTLDRPQALNALNSVMIDEIGRAIDDFEANARIAAVVITGSDKAFAAGADIKEMADQGFVEAFVSNHAAALNAPARSLLLTMSPCVTWASCFGRSGSVRATLEGMC